MHGATGLAIGFGVRLVMFTVVFWLAPQPKKGRLEAVRFKSKWLAPLVGLVFALLDIALYWVLTHGFDLATFGAISFVMPLIVNGLLLFATVKLFAWREQMRGWFTIDSVVAGLWMVVFLTVVQGLCWLGLDYLPNHL